MTTRDLDDTKREQIVSAVVERLAPAISGVGPVTMPAANPALGGGCGPAPANIVRGASNLSGGRLGVFDDVDSAVAAARAAHEHLVHKLTLADRRRIIEAFRQAGRDKNQEISHLAVEETRLGRVDHKLRKNALVIEKTPGLEILKSYAESGDDGLMLLERAPWGVIGAITPTTNPTETIICNGIGMVAGGNGVVFNVHPSAKRVCRVIVEAINASIVSAGGPDNLICMVAEPTIASAEALMKHPGTRLTVVTGGPGVVKAAMNSGKRAICGGPGNPPVVVDETADIRVAAQGILDGHGIDNNIVCIAEKEIFCVSDVADLLKREMVARGAVALTSAEIAKLEGVVFEQGGPYGHPQKEWVGQNASKIAAAIGKRVPDDTVTLLCEVDSEDHPFVQAELLMPVLPLVRVPDVATGIAAAVRAEHGYGHTAGMYSTNIDALHAMARAVDTSIFVKNAPHLAGLGFHGEGWTSFTIASPTGEGLTTAVHFTRERRCTLKDRFRIV